MKILSAYLNAAGDAVNIHVESLNTEKIYDVRNKLQWRNVLAAAGFTVKDEAGLSVYFKGRPIYRATFYGRIMVHKKHLRLAEILTKAITGESLDSAMRAKLMIYR